MYEQLYNREIEYVRGKISGSYVQDDNGNTIISPGEVITEEVIRKAKEAGQIHYLMIAAVSAQLQPESGDLVRKLHEFKEVTEGHEAEFVRMRKAGRDVKDFSGNIFVRQGDVISDETIQRATDMGMLQELVLSVGAPGLVEKWEDMRRQEEEEEHPAHKSRFELEA